MEIQNKIPVVEAVLFASGEPVDAERLCGAAELVKDELDEVIAELELKYSKPDSGIELLHLNDRYQLATKQAFAPQVRSALEIKKNSQLSPAALETLTIIAYNQPVTKGFVENVRGVDSSLDKEAVRVVQSSPKWKPGKQRDRAVKVTYTFPVIFQLR